MMKLGIRAHDVKIGLVEDVAKTIKDYGFRAVQLVINKAIKDENGNLVKLDYDNVISISTTFKDDNLEVAMLGCYFNPVHSSKEKVLDSIDYFKKHLELSHFFNCKYVGTETGSYNDDKWTFNLRNHTEEAFNEVYEVVKALVETARKYNSCVLIEPAYNHVIYNAQTLKRLLDLINDIEHINVTIDIFNLLNINNYQDYQKIFLECLTLFNERVKIIHLKDFYVSDNNLIQTNLGEGIIDFAFIITIIKKYAPNAVLVFEGIVNEGISKSIKHINSHI